MRVRDQVRLGSGDVVCELRSGMSGLIVWGIQACFARRARLSEAAGDGYRAHSASRT